MLVAFAFVLWFLSVYYGWQIGRSKDEGLEGLLLGACFGPIGVLIALKL